MKKKTISKLDANKMSIEKIAQVRGGRRTGPGGGGGRPPKWVKS